TTASRARTSAAAPSRRGARAAAILLLRLRCRTYRPCRAECDALLRGSSPGPTGSPSLAPASLAPSCVASSSSSASSNRHPIVHGLLRPVSAIGVAAALAARERDAESGDERQHALQEIAGRIRQQVEHQR